MELVKSDKEKKPSTRDCGNSLHCLMLDKEEGATTSDCRGSRCQIKVEETEESSTNSQHSVDWVESGEGDGPPASDHHNSVVLVKVEEGEEPSFVSRWVSKDWAKHEKEEPSSKHTPGSVTLVKIEVGDEPSSQVAQKVINHIKFEEMEEPCSKDCPGSRNKESFEEQNISDHKSQILMKWVAFEGDEERFPKEGERMEGSATGNRPITATSNLLINSRTLDIPQKTSSATEGGHGQSTELEEKSTVSPMKQMPCPDCGNSVLGPSHFLKKQVCYIEGKPHKWAYNRHSTTQCTKLMKAERIQTEENDFTCRDCGNSFIDESSLMIHNRLHLGEKLSKCEKISIQSSFVHEHQGSHAKEILHQCTECEKSFIGSENLHRHRMMHFKSESYRDMECTRQSQ